MGPDRRLDVRPDQKERKHPAQRNRNHHHAEGQDDRRPQRLVERRIGQDVAVGIEASSATERTASPENSGKG